jgi:nitrate/nitrite transporter NarK
LLGLSFAVPMILFPLLGGAIADRVNRMKLLYVTQTLMMLNAFALAALAGPAIARGSASRAKPPLPHR